MGSIPAGRSSAEGRIPMSIETGEFGTGSQESKIRRQPCATAKRHRAFMKIRIISTPPGEAPEHIRQAWVGLVLPVPGMMRRKGGYLVAADKAIEILSRQAPEAAKWWHQNKASSIARGMYFVFADDVCEVAENHPTYFDKSRAFKSTFVGCLGLILSVMELFARHWMLGIFLFFASAALLALGVGVAKERISSGRKKFLLVVVGVCLVGILITIFENK